ncbi:MAG: hypothetical protein IKE70_06180 [Bacilli bacterium]|nr:hypothetical protein [Bacilli bacterium]
MKKNMIKFDFSTISIPLSGKVVNYICPKCKVEFEAPLEMVEKFEMDDMLHNLPVSTPPYTICPKCSHDKCVPIDYKSMRGYHYKYKG